MSQTENRVTDHYLSRTLAEIGIGESGTILKILGGIRLKHRLEAMGMRPGTTIEKIAGSPFGGPVVIRIGTIRLAIGHGMAGKVMVDVGKADAS